MDIRDHGGSFGGNALIKNSFIPFYKLDISNPPQVASIALNSSYNQNLVAKYASPDGKLGIIPVYNGSNVVTNLFSTESRTSFASNSLYSYTSHGSMRAILVHDSRYVCIGNSGLSIYNLLNAGLISTSTSAPMFGGRALQRGELMYVGANGLIREFNIATGTLVRTANLSTGVTSTQVDVPLAIDDQGNLYGYTGDRTLVKFTMTGNRVYSVAHGATMHTTTTGTLLNQHHAVWSKKRGTLLVVQVRNVNKNGTSMYVPYLHEINSETGAIVNIIDLHTLADIVSDSGMKCSIHLGEDQVVVAVANRGIVFKENDFSVYQVVRSNMTNANNDFFTINSNYYVSTNDTGTLATIQSLGVKVK